MKEERNGNKNETMRATAKHTFRIYWVLVLLGMLAISAYPIYMGIKVI